MDHSFPPSNSRLSLTKSQPLKQILEPGIFADIIEHRIDLDLAQPNISTGKGQRSQPAGRFIGGQTDLTY
jgi:hypothetical protein